jgi:hypothetical protein
MSDAAGLAENVMPVRRHLPLAQRTPFHQAFKFDFLHE